ncbi:MAG TPA: pitrilysin family protein [Bacillota bacterium]|nr:pitrilysin family protein [Bacillota bacterium]
MKPIDYRAIDETLYRKTLANGLTVFLLPREQMEKTFAIFSTDYGSIDQTFVPIGESDAINVPEGVAHFLEHKLFEKEDYDVFTNFSKQGASANAYTSFTKTAYLFSATANIEQNVKTLIDFVQDPYFSDESVEKEKGIIAQEIMMYDDQPGWQLFMGTIKNMFHKHPVNIDIAGTVDSIETITKEDLYVCYETFYHPENMTLFIAGNFNPESMVSLIENNQATQDFPKAERIQRLFPNEPKHVVHEERTIEMPISMPKCAIGIKRVPENMSPEQFIMIDLLEQMILDYFYSKGGIFYQELYQDGLIDHSFSFSTTLEKNFGYAIISSSTDEPDQLAKKIKEQLHSVKTFQFKTEDIEKMKHKQIGQILRSMNSLESIANNYIHYNSHGVDFFELINKVQQLTIDDFTTFLTDWITDEQLTVCKIVAPIQED